MVLCVTSGHVLHLCPSCVSDDVSVIWLQTLLLKKVSALDSLVGQLAFTRVMS